MVSNSTQNIQLIPNTVKKGILHAVNGSFSSKWATVSNECGYEVGILDYEFNDNGSVLYYYISPKIE